MQLKCILNKNTNIDFLISFTLDKTDIQICFKSVPFYFTIKLRRNILTKFNSFTASLFLLENYILFSCMLNLFYNKYNM